MPVWVLTAYLFVRRLFPHASHTVAKPNFKSGFDYPIAFFCLFAFLNHGSPYFRMHGWTRRFSWRYLDILTAMPVFITHFSASQPADQSCFSTLSLGEKASLARVTWQHLSQQQFFNPIVPLPSTPLTPVFQKPKTVAQVDSDWDNKGVRLQWEFCSSVFGQLNSGDSLLDSEVTQQPLIYVSNCLGYIMHVVPTSRGNLRSLRR